MRIDILAVGSRGDVQPYLALGLGLRAAGHRVRFVTLGGFEKFVGGHGFDHLAIGASPQEIAQTDAGRDWVKKRSSVLGYLSGFVRVAASKLEEGLLNYWRAARETEAVITAPMGLLVGVHIAERLGVPLIRSQADPQPVPTLYNWNGRKSLRTALSTSVAFSIDIAFNLLMWNLLRGATNAARRRILDLPPLPRIRWAGRRLPLMCGYSPVVSPTGPDLPKWIHVTGYWFLDDVPGWSPPRQLADFLASGPPPVFIGFGSTPFPNPEAATELVVRAVTRAGRRGIVVAGGSGLATGQLSQDVLSIDTVPHDWLFPRVSAAVHHGGAGVTGAALRAGLPSVVVPVFGDQPFWGKTVHRLGAGPRPIPAKALTEDNLSRAIRATDSIAIRRRAAELGAQIRREDGVARAVEIIEQHLGRGDSNRRRHQHAR
ncbi:MAG: glycosyltransferase family 1 protein [Acidobacteriia bacterium]|nr:glycosyltransferase family 1 protein [Terriglobia bacterium]MBV8905738.1 glycosyltransferase family 1 protein [Terriglobia bacterium]